MTPKDCNLSDILKQIKRLWREGRDTMGIARKLKISEACAYNLLSKARNSGSPD